MALTKTTTVLLVLFLFSGCGHSSAVETHKFPSTANIPGYKESAIKEPVFGGRIFVTEAGPKDATPVVLVHGLGDDGARDWQSLMARLAVDHRVLAFDLPGFARSTKANKLYEPIRYVKLIKWLTEERIGKPFHLVGHSMGASISLLYAATHKNDVKTLTLADAAGILEHHVLVSQMAAPKKRHRLNPFSRSGSGTMRSLDIMFLDLGKSIDKRLDSFLETPDSRETYLGGSPRKIAALALLLHNFGPAINSVESPTLLIWGRDDNIAPLRTGRVLQNAIPSARLEILDHVGHVPMREKPEAFEHLVLNHISEQRTSAELPKKNAVPADVNTWQRVGTCDRQREIAFTGDYKEIRIEDCDQVTLKNVRVKHLFVDDSRVSLENTNIYGDKSGLQVRESTLRMTNGSISGDIAIQTDGSVLDLAGVTFRPKTAVASTKRSSKLVFSVCRAEEENQTYYLHGLRQIQPQKTL